MVGRKEPDFVWCIKQLNQDLSNSYIFMELPTGVQGLTGNTAMQVHLIISISMRVK